MNFLRRMPHMRDIKFVVDNNGRVWPHKIRCISPVTVKIENKSEWMGKLLHTNSLTTSTAPCCSKSLLNHIIFVWVTPLNVWLSHKCVMNP